jgi:hypothetical protein
MRLQQPDQPYPFPSPSPLNSIISGPLGTWASAEAPTLPPAPGPLCPPQEYNRVEDVLGRELREAACPEATLTPTAPPRTWPAGRATAWRGCRASCSTRSPSSTAPSTRCGVCLVGSVWLTHGNMSVAVYLLLMFGLRGVTCRDRCPSWTGPSARCGPARVQDQWGSGF